MSHSFYAGEGSCLNVDENALSVKYNKAKLNKMKYTNKWKRTKNYLLPEFALKCVTLLFIASVIG